MLTPSAEQQAIIDAVAAGKNVVVDAVAGSGKTTTVLAIADAVPTKTVFQITFNSQLKSEVRAKVVIEGLGNLHVHTYHSLATTFYDRTAYTDAKIMAIMEQDARIRGAPRALDILIIDEAQDMTLLYFRLVNKFVRDVGGAGQIVVLGDRYQGVYEFMKADTRFLTLAEKLWRPEREFVYMGLRESYRVTKPIAWFINNVMLGEERIVSKKESKVQVEWYICNPFADMDHLFLKDLVKQIKRGDLRPDDIFVLAASLKSGTSPTRRIENLLVNSRIPVCVPISDEGRLDEDVTRGKVVFATFPSSKGRERPIVILTGFDQGYFEYYAKNLPKDACPSTLYVAATRAMKRLILVSDEKCKGLSFLDSQLINTPAFTRNVTYENDNLLLTKEPPKPKSASGVEKKTSVMDLVKYLPQEAIEYLTPIVARLFETLHPPLDAPIPIACKIRTGNSMYEDVSHLNGLAIPAMWESRTASASASTSASFPSTSSSTSASASAAAPTMLGRIRDPKIMKKKYSADPFIKNAIKAIKPNPATAPEFLYMSNVYWTITEGYHGQLAQIKSYEWLESEATERCIDLLETHVGSDGCEFEVDVGVTIQTIYGRIMISGTIDIISGGGDTVWEVKCTDSFQLEHMMQLILYYWLCSKQPEPPARYKLINIRSGEVRQLNPSPCHVQNIVDTLLDYKYKTAERADDATFIQQVTSSPQAPSTPN